MASAQSMEGQSAVSVKTGVGGTGLFIKAAAARINESSGDSTTEREVVSQNNPAIALEYGYSISDNFSIGILGSVQVYTGTIKNYGFIAFDNKFKVENVDYNIRRTFFGVTPNYHWNTDNENLDLYSGGRIGYVVWSNKFDTNDPNFEFPERFRLGRPAVGIVPIGGTAYFTENLGGNFELALGAPFILSAGLEFRF